MPRSAASSNASSTRCGAFKRCVSTPLRRPLRRSTRISRSLTESRERWHQGSKRKIMLVVMQEGAAEEKIQAVIDRLVGMGFTIHRSTGVRHTILGGVGPVENFDPLEFEVMEGVKESHRIVSPYKLANRTFRPEGTVIRVGELSFGGDDVVVMAGPCSVESEAQIRQS